MKTASLVALALGAALVGGCSGPSKVDRLIAAEYAVPPAEAPSVLHDRAVAAAGRQDDPYAGTLLMGLPQAATDCKPIRVSLWQMRPKGGEETSVLQVHYWWPAWAMLSYVIDLDGRRFDCAAPSRSVAGSNVSELLVLPVPTEWVEAHRETGVKFRAYGDAGTIDFEIPGWYFAAFIDAVKLQPDMGAAYRAAPATVATP